jgi:hypothetical protein
MGNKMLDFLEKQIILGKCVYSLDLQIKGEQDLLEEKYPELAEKAKKFMGYEDYYKLKEDMRNQQHLEG